MELWDTADYVADCTRTVGGVESSMECKWYWVRQVLMFNIYQLFYPQVLVGMLDWREKVYHQPISCTGVEKVMQYNVYSTYSHLSTCTHIQESHGCQMVSIVISGYLMSRVCAVDMEGVSLVGWAITVSVMKVTMAPTVTCINA